ncbi:SRPBCC family protein, partial [Actinomadura montaniterrae]
MKLENAFTIPVPADEAWRVLLDIERIAPCVPGATLTSRDGDRFDGKVKVRLGPIGLTYSGSVAFVSLDEDAGVAVMEAAGRETRGGGTAKAVVTCRLTGRGGTTDVQVETDLAITGKPVQFGRGALADVSAALLGRFAANLAEEIAPGGDASPAPDASSGTG